MRGIARHLQINYKTVERKFLFLAQRAYKLTTQVKELQFDDFETIEHTKCKPLSILVCVDGQGEPLALNVAQMPAKGKLAAFSVKKYGKRLDERRKVALSTFASLKINPSLIKTDAKSSYRTLIKEFWPLAKHEVFNRAEKERLQSRLHENKHKKKYDPLFRLNHMCARLRADIRRLTRRSWCTTKRKDRLQAHLNLYIYYRQQFC